jgi:ribonuclease HI
MASLSQRIPFPHSVEAVEATAARAAVTLALDLGFKEVEVEGDSITIVKALSQSESHYTFYGHIINDIKFASQLLVSVKFMHVKRDGNKVAHSLARRARGNQPFQVWLESVSPDIVQTLYSDYSFQ